MRDLSRTNRHNGRVRSVNLEQRTFALRHLYVYPSVRISYTYIPKNASTSMKQTLGQAQGWWSEGDSSVHEVNRVHWLGGLIRYPRTHERIVIIRDPWDRLISAFQNRFVGRDKAASEQALRDGLATQLPKDADRMHVSFAQFLEYLARTPDRRLNEHWRPQTSFLIGNYTQMMRFEHLQQDADFLTERGLKLRTATGHGTGSLRQDLGPGWGYRPASALRKLKRRRRVLPSRASMFDDPLAELVSDRFAADIELFNTLSRALPDESVSGSGEQLQ